MKPRWSGGFRRVLVAESFRVFAKRDWFRWWEVKQANGVEQGGFYRIRRFR